MAGSGSTKKLPKGAPGWVVTFGDMMSLLLTFFVLLFTYSQLDAEKYKALAGSLREAFGSTLMEQMTGMVSVGGDTTAVVVLPAKEPPQVAQPAGDQAAEAKEKSETPADIPAAAADVDDVDEEDLIDGYEEVMKARVTALQAELRKAVAQELHGARIEVSRLEENVLIRFPSEIAFASGRGQINEQFAGLLANLRPLLKGAPGEVIVSGHTDDVPISGGRYRSNWELSAARATSVVHALVQDGGISPHRVTVQGFGDSRPLVANETDANRARNRRVEIKIAIPKVAPP